MSSLPERLITPPTVEYLVLDGDLQIEDFSERVVAFADDPQAVAVGEFVGKAFPELIGAEQVLHGIWSGEKGEYELREVARRDLYFNLWAFRAKSSLVLLFEEVTEMISLKQSLVQRANETELLFSALKHSKNYLDKVIASMGDALIITNRQGVIKSVNQAAVDIFGYAIAEFVGQPWQIFLPTKLWQQELSPIAIIAAQQEIKTVEVDCRHKQGDRLMVEFNCSQVIADLTQEESFVYVGRNITARREAEREQQKAIAKERELVELRSRFLSTAAHEFRNPVGSILMCAEMLQMSQGKLSDDEQTMYIEFIQQAGRSLKTIMEDILLLSRIDAGKLRYNPTTFDLQPFCDNLIQTVHLAMNDHRIQLDYPTAIATVTMDAKLLQHILQNILSNALKYSPNQQPVDLIIRPNLGAAEYLDFIVRDRGIGIPAKDLEHVCDSFHRAKNVGEIPGTGLGMAITDKFIELHHGSIHIDSQENQGTTVTVTLPRR